MHQKYFWHSTDTFEDYGVLSYIKRVTLYYIAELWSNEVK